MSSMIPDPDRPHTYLIESASEPDFGIQLGEPAVLVNVHPEENCRGRHCVVHNPSDHHMRTWRLNYRADRGVMERVCQHGTGHPDPDDYAWHLSQGRGYMGTHGCDGCCEA